MPGFTVKNTAREALEAAGEVRKALATLLGVAALVAELGLLHGQAEVWAGVGTAAATVALTYLAPNGPIIRKLDDLADTGTGFVAEPAVLADPPDTDVEPMSQAPAHPSPSAAPPPPAR